MYSGLHTVQLNSMDEHTRNNWNTVRKALLAAGKTDSFLYKQAVSVTDGHGLIDKHPDLVNAEEIAKQLLDEKES